MAPTFRQLEMFRLLMRSNNLTETARQMRVSQPATSQALRELEGLLGIMLFHRGGSQLRPTEEALALLPDVERLFAQISSLTSHAAELKDSLGGRINIAATPVLVTSILPRAIAQYRVERPRSHVVLQSMATQDVVDLIRQEHIDIGLVFAPFDEAHIELEPLIETSLCCCLPAGHRLAERQLITVADLVDETVIGLTTQIPPGELLRKELRKHDVENLIDVETNSAISALSMVQCGVGVAIVDPFAGLSSYSLGVVMRPISPTVKLTVTALFSRYRTPSRAVTQFLDHTRAVLQQVPQQLDSSLLIRILGNTAG